MGIVGITLFIVGIFTSSTLLWIGLILLVLSWLMREPKL
jgi:hypothetical protein